MLTDEEIEWFRRVRSAMGHSPDEASGHVQSLLKLSEHSPTLSALVEEHRAWAMVRGRLMAAVRLIGTLLGGGVALTALLEWWQRR